MANKENKTMPPCNHQPRGATVHIVATKTEDGASSPRLSTEVHPSVVMEQLLGDELDLTSLADEPRRAPPTKNCDGMGQ